MVKNIGQHILYGLAFLFLLVGCGTQQATVAERDEVVGERSAEGVYAEAQQIDSIETWKDRESKIVNAYILNPVTGGLLIPPLTCLGVPASSTESLEPNHGLPRHRSGWVVPMDGVDVVTDELAGRDGTFGDPVHFRQCMTVDGHYIDWPAYGIPYIISSQSYTFEPATVSRNFENEARLIEAEEVLRDGGCVDYETLEEVPCDE